MKEKWKDIKGYENLYRISNFGNVLNIKRNLIRKKTINNDGYYVVSLSKKNKKKVYLVHRLVAENFLDKEKYKKYKNENNDILTINHINENKLDNNVNNLEWCTNTYNIKYSEHKIRRYKKIVLEIENYIKNENLPSYVKDDLEKILFRKRVKYNDG